MIAFIDTHGDDYGIDTELNQREASRYETLV